MRKLVLFIILFVPLIVSAQTYTLNYDSIRYAKPVNTSKNAFYGRVFLKNFSPGNLRITLNGEIVKNDTLYARVNGGNIFTGSQQIFSNTEGFVVRNPGLTHQSSVTFTGFSHAVNGLFTNFNDEGFTFRQTNSTLKNTASSWFDVTDPTKNIFKGTRPYEFQNSLRVLPQPTNVYDATNKRYVDSLISASGSSAISGTVNTLAKFGTANSVTNSSLSDDGNIVTQTGQRFETVNTSGTATLRALGNASGANMLQSQLLLIGNNDASQAAVVRKLSSTSGANGNLGLRNAQSGADHLSITTGGLVLVGASSDNGSGARFQVSSGTSTFSGNIGAGVTTAPAARVDIAAGSATVTPLRMASGVLNTTPVAGAMEFLTDKPYVVISTGTARKEYTLNDVALNIGIVPVTTTNGRLTNSAVTATELGYLSGVGAPTGSGAIVLNNSPTFTGTPTAPTASTGTNTAQLATTAFVQQELINFPVRTTVLNSTGSTIPAGSVVYISGSSGGVPQVSLAQANAAATTVALGVTNGAIANGSTGTAVSLGTVLNLNTSGFTVGAIYLSPTTPGGLTQTVPTTLGQYRYRVGFVTDVNASTGKIHVTPTTAVRIDFAYNGTTTGLSAATLNSTYPNAQLGDKVYCTNIALGGATYTKVTANSGGTTWSMNNTTPVM